MYKLDVEVSPGVRFSVEEEAIGDLFDDVEKLGGHAGSLNDRIAVVFAAMPHGNGATELARGMGARVKTVEHATERQEQADPWASDSDSEPSEDQAPTRSTPARSAPVRSRNGASSGGNSRSSTFTDRWGNKYTFDLPEAPECECGDPAARKQGKSRAGKRYTVWVCAKAGTEDQWGDKCDFSEFPQR